MSKLYHPFPLRCFDKLKEETLLYMNQFHKDNLYIKLLPVSEETLNMFNNEMTEYGLSAASNFLCFKRKYFFRETAQVHIDTDSANETVHSSIVLPIEGCKDTYMYWIDGKYDVVSKITPVGTSYVVLKWKSIPKFVDRVEISNVPTLTKVSVPHDATSHRDGSYRTVLTIRLLGNPTFDEILQKRFDNNLIV